MSDDPGRLICLLAGMPASGTTDLLEQDRRDLFGSYSAQAAAFGGMAGKRYHHFVNLKAKADGDPNFSWPMQSVVHLEISAACSLKLKPYEMFRDEDFILNLFRENLSGMLSHYDTFVVNTVEPDLPLLAHRFLSRVQGERSDNLYLLYKNRDEATLSRIFNAWNRYLSEINCVVLRTRWDHRSKSYIVADGAWRAPMGHQVSTQATAYFSAQWRASFKPGQ